MKLFFALCALVSAGLVAGQVHHLPTFSMDTLGDSACPPENQLDGIRADISNKISDFLAEKVSCGGAGWRRVVLLNMTDPSQTCPSQWRLYEQDSLRLCGMKTFSGSACDSVKFDTEGRAYTKVCGRIIGYQYASPNGATHDNPTAANAINEPYLDGVSITYGRPRKHIWSFFGMFTPWRCCEEKHLNNTEFLGFVGNNSFCDTGNIDNADWQETLFTNHTLWDGVAGCVNSATCCHSSAGPWFQTTLAAPTVSDIEVRICSDQHTDNEDTPLELVEIYVK